MFHASWVLLTCSCLVRQPLGNHDIYLKYTKLIEDLLESFLSSHGIDHQVVRVAFALGFCLSPPIM